MKKVFSLILALCLATVLAGCTRPDDIQMDVAQGFGENTKLIHLNASSQAKQERMLAVYRAVMRCAPLEKDPAMFAYYPDFQVTLMGIENEKGILSATGEKAVITAVVDINGDWVDIMFPEGAGTEKEPGVIYRSQVTAKEFRALMNVE